MSHRHRYVGLLDTLNLRRKNLVVLRSDAAFVGVSQQRCMGLIRRRGDLQDLVERLDPERSAMLVDELLQNSSWRSSSA